MLLFEIINKTCCSCSLTANLFALLLYSRNYFLMVIFPVGRSRLTVHALCHSWLTLHIRLTITNCLQTSKELATGHPLCYRQLTLNIHLTITNCLQTSKKLAKVRACCYSRLTLHMRLTITNCLQTSKELAYSASFAGWAAWVCLTSTNTVEGSITRLRKRGWTIWEWNKPRNSGVICVVSLALIWHL